METVVLKGKDFKRVHNALCQLRSIRNLLEPVVREPLLDKLSATVREMEEGLQDAYAQDHAAFDRKLDLYAAVREHWRLNSNWSIFEVEDLEAQHPFEGATEVVYTDHWGDEPVIEAIPVEGKGHGTWLDLWRAADQCIRRSGDGHHCFIEAFSPVAEKPHQLRLTTGS